MSESDKQFLEFSKYTFTQKNNHVTLNLKDSKAGATPHTFELKPHVDLDKGSGTHSPIRATKTNTRTSNDGVVRLQYAGIEEIKEKRELYPSYAR